MAIAAKVYDFQMPKVEDQLVSFLKRKQGSSTVADMIAGTGLPKYQVEQAAKVALDEYAGRLKVTESGELLYYFPAGMRSTVHGLGPTLRRFWKSFAKGALRVLSLAFKIWIVAMLVGYFVAFVAIAVLAIVASFAASAANRSDSRGGGGRGRGGFGSMYLVIRLFELMLQMWFWSSLTQPQKKRDGRAFYKSVFGFVFGDGDPNKDWDEAERKYVISYVKSHKGVITLEEFMTLTGRESENANALLNRFLLEFEGEPGVTDNGTLIYSFPALMRTTEQAGRAIGAVPVLNSNFKKPVPFSANKPKTNGWILFFNAVNLGFGAYFLVLSLTQNAAFLLAKNGPYLYSFTAKLLQSIGINNPVHFLAIALGIVPAAFSIVFFIVPLLRKIRLGKKNAEVQEENLRRRVLAQVLSNPERVDSRDVHPLGKGLDPRNLPAAAKRIVERLAAAMKAEPIAGDGKEFAYKFTELERQIPDLDEYRRKVDLSQYALGKTVFDSGQ
jgi:hypothetical protein